MDLKTMDHAVKALKIDSPGRDRLLQLNNDNARETSHLTAERFAGMIESARVATVIEPALAFMLAFDQDDNYDGGHFQWFRQRLDRFLYIDRVIVSAPHRRHGLGRLLYEDLIVRAGRLDCRLIACEVNFRPPNPVSDAFHARFGFVETGRVTMDNGEKGVRYLIRREG
jgi:predicted GNAT superfamily acetyltransferase